MGSILSVIAIFIGFGLGEYTNKKGVSKEKIAMSLWWIYAFLLFGFIIFVMLHK